jgi:hypothetical protein
MSDDNPTPVDPFDSPDHTLPTEDDNPESLAGEPVQFDPDAPDDGDDSEHPAGA